ncbi:MarR family transcriptional regulator [Nocardioides sp. TF02-7]|uniref:MarR family winged helix-turn-helix transcriptional regulator n=1 Tax=Nocardioides sp. TF02-7 TaxID=2917724 RepID=UPI001F0532F3|nr:MarR family transcriptional regulator [Nocardioides sp. TF02-7]UMG93947.1 MarR family transcriptional regulator [Nocardioides sp. TF02-7]
MTGSPWLDDEQQTAWRAWLEVHTRLSARINRELQATSGLSLADYEVLVALTDVAEGSIRLRDLGDQLQWEKSRLSKHLTRMQRRGLVARRDCADDRRGAFVGITDQGRTAIRSAAPAHVDLVRRVFFDGITPEQVRQLTAVLDAVRGRLGD